MLLFVIVLLAHYRESLSELSTCSCSGRIAGGGTGNYNLIGVTPRSCDQRGVDSMTGTCYPYQRSANGYCNNPKYPLDGMTNTPQFSYVDGHSNARVEVGNLRSARDISNTVGHQAKPIPNSSRLSDLVTFFAQFLDHMLFSTAESDEDSEEFPVKIDQDDPILCNFTRSSVPFRRSVRGCVLDNPSLSRPINALSSAVDLTGVYGSSAESAEQLRQKKDGLLKVSIHAGKEYLPRNGNEFDKVSITLPSEAQDKQFFVAGDHRANENPVLTSIHTIFLREHNRIARDLKSHISVNEIKGDPLFQGDLDEALYQFAKRINEAQFQRVVLEEFIPAITGSQLQITYDPDTRHAVSDLFSTCAFRVGHTMVGEKIQLRDRQSMTLKKEIPLSELFFKSGDNFIGEKLDEFMSGAVMNRAQEIDTMITNALRNHLFINVQGSNMAIDLLLLNLQRGRDHGIPSYNGVRKLVGLSRVVSFSAISSDKATEEKLRVAYDSVDDVEAWVGLMAEDHAPGRPMGNTLIKVWELEFKRVFGGDRFFYKQSLFHPVLKSKYQSQIDIMLTGAQGMREIILANTDISALTFPQNIWKT